MVFGALAETAGLVEALLAAAALAAISAATIRIWPFLDTTGMYRSTVVYWPEPQLAPGVDPDGRPVVVLSRYRVAAEAEREFVAAMALLRDSRLRIGAVRWGLYRDGESATRSSSSSSSRHGKSTCASITSGSRARTARSSSACRVSP